MSGLRATTVQLDEPADLLAAAGDTGYLWREEYGGLAAHGVAARIDLPDGLEDGRALRRVTELLAGIDHDGVDLGVPGSGPVALGALPFDPSVPGQLVIPQRTVGRRGDLSWVTTIEGGDLSGGPQPFGPPSSPPDEFSLVSSMPHAEWKDTVAEAVEAIGRGDLVKVVLARRIDISANRPFVVSDVLERLAALYPSCMVFSIDGFIGASPELLIRRSGPSVESHPLAGTVARSGDAHGDEALVARLMSSPKARHEHQVVVEAIVDALRPLTDTIDAPTVPSVLGLRNVSHLATRVVGQLRGDRPLPSALELVARIHPTPAVGGRPTRAAIDYIQKVEGFDRHCYTGPVGWVDGRGDGAWALGIRCAEVDGAHARIYAGNGIVAGSDPTEELAETQLKLQALLAALVRP